jgi:hypothetical protein
MAIRIASVLNRGASLLSNGQVRAAASGAGSLITTSRSTYPSLNPPREMQALYGYAENMKTP